MTEHYYSENPNTRSEPVFWSAQLKGNSFRFKTDNGVFSKSEVDFGSKLLIDSFEDPAVSGPFLDAGCGYGPIGLALAKKFPERYIHMIDVNERALKLAKENASLNEIHNTIIYHSDRLTNVKENNFSAILTNPPIRAGKKVVHDIFEQSYEQLGEGGELWVVIQKKQGAPSAKDKLMSIFKNVETVKKDKGYYIFKSKKV